MRDRSTHKMKIVAVCRLCPKVYFTSGAPKDFSVIANPKETVPIRGRLGWKIRRHWRRYHND